MIRPYCRECGRKLGFHRAHRAFATAALARAFVAAQPRALRKLAQIKDDTATAKLNPGHPFYAEGSIFVSYVDAFGRYGDNLFCGLSCGYRFGVTMARAVEEARK